MSKKLPSFLALSIAGAVLVTVGACKPADKGQGALKSGSFAALDLSESEKSVFSKYFATEPCAAEEMEALGALAGLGLGESGANQLSFEARDVSAGLVTYRNFNLQEEGSLQPRFFAKSAVFHCPQMRDDAPNFARLDLADVSINDERAKVEFTAKSLNIANPTSNAARSIVESMTRGHARSSADIGFGAISMTNAKIKSNEINGTLGALSWGEIRDETGQGKADITVKDVNLVVPGQNGAQDMTLDFKGMNVRNLNIGRQTNADQALSSNGRLGSFLEYLTAQEKPYDELIIEQLNVKTEGFTIDFAGLEGKATEDAGVVTTRQSLKPVKIVLNPILGEIPTLAENYELMKIAGLETMTLSGHAVTTRETASDSISVSDGLFVMDDVFRLNFEYEAEGLKQSNENLQSLLESNSNPDFLSAYDSLKLREFRFTLEDNSIVEKGLKLASVRTGRSEKNIKRLLSGAVLAAALAAENEAQAEVYTTTVAAFAKFVKNGGTLTIEANPAAPFSPVSLISGKGEDVDPDSLGFSASQDNPTE